MEGSPRKPAPRRRRKALLAGPARVVRNRLPAGRPGIGYRPERVDIVLQNTYDGFHVWCREVAAVDALRAYGARPDRAPGRDQLLETWPSAPEQVARLLRRTLELAARELRWAEPGDPGDWDRSTRSAIERFLRWTGGRPPAAP
jgi:hypothetical protein